MNPAHLHLLLNHIPVLGTVFGLALLGFGLWRKSEELKRTALGVYVIVALFTVPVYLTGEPAEGVVDSLPGVSQTRIDDHEKAATVAFTSVLVLGLGALLGLLLRRRRLVTTSWFGWLMLVAAGIVVGLMVWTANLGGQIRHTEISAHPGSTTAPAAR